MYWAVGPDRPAARQNISIHFLILRVGCCDNTPPFLFGADILHTFN